MPSFTLTSSDIGHQADSPLTEVHSGILEQEQSGFQRLQRHLATASGRREDILGVDMFLTADDLESRRVLAVVAKVENEPARRRGAPPADAPDGFIGLGPKLDARSRIPCGKTRPEFLPEIACPGLAILPHYVIGRGDGWGGRSYSSRVRTSGPPTRARCPLYFRSVSRAASERCTTSGTKTTGASG